MTMAIKQHWLPQFYLKTFATSKGGETVWVTDIQSAYQGQYTTHKSKVGEIVYSEHLYSLAREDGNFEPDQPNSNSWDDSIDKFLQTLEAEAGVIWKQLQLKSDDINLSPGSDTRMKLATFLASLHLRNPRMVGVAKLGATAPIVPSLLTTKDREAFHKAVAGTPVDLSPTLAGIEDRTAFLAAQFEMLPHVSEVLNRLHWTLQIFPGNTASGPLVTTDTPLLCVDRLTMDATGMETPNCMVMCPLTSRALLIATQTPTTTKNGAVIVGLPKFAVAANSYIVHFGVRHAYSGFELGKNFRFLSDVPIPNT